MKTYEFKLALSQIQIKEYFQLRQVIFCQEQGLFEQRDYDEYDIISYPIIAINGDDKVVGVARIYEVDTGFWYGGRLGVHQDYRHLGIIGKGLINQAVSIANNWGCDRFLATVQLQNVSFFQRLHWQSLRDITINNRPHHLMEAELDFYPPTNQPRPLLETLRIAC